MMMYLKRLLRTGVVKRVSELFLFTANEVAERTYFRGSSLSSRLHQMTLELWKIELDGELIIRFIWILGKRMISQGTDGVSWADLLSVEIGGQNFLKYLPLDETAFEKQQGLTKNLLSWVDKGLQVATTEDWFD